MTIARPTMNGMPADWKQICMYAPKELVDRFDAAVRRRWWAVPQRSRAMRRLMAEFVRQVEKGT